MRAGRQRPKGSSGAVLPSKQIATISSNHQFPAALTTTFGLLLEFRAPILSFGAMPKPVPRNFGGVV